MNNVFKFFRETSTGRFFIPLGIILVIFGIVFLFSINNSKNFIKTEAVVSKLELFEEAYNNGDTEFDATYTVYVKYTVDGVDYEEEYGVFSDYKENDKVTIAYNPDNPKEIVQPNSIILPIILIILGILSFTFGVISLVKSIKKYKKLKLQEKEWENGN